MTVSRAPREISESFCAVVDGILGAYLEASMGMGTLAGQWIEWHSQKLDEVAASGVEEKRAALNPSVTLTGTVAGKPADLHSTSLNDLIARNAPNGANWQLFANLCIIAVYAYWEDEFRQELAVALGVEKNALKDDVFGELRHLRRSIVHNSSRALPEVGRNRVLKSFRSDESIVFSHQEVIDLADAVRAAARRVSSGPPSPAA